VDFLKDNGAGESLSLYVVGYGEGGSYSAWFSKCISLPSFCPYYTLASLPAHALSLSSFYKLKGAAAMEGALDLAGTTQKFMTKEVGIEFNNN
jgi:hypothetical protein